MANRDNPHGLHNIGRTLSGGMPYVQQLKKVVGYAVALYYGDVIARVADGSLQIPATPGTTLPSGVNLTYGAASKATDHLVITSPDALFEAQDEGTGVAEADLGLNANLIYGAGSAASLKSGHEIDGSTKAVTGTLDVHLLALLDEADNVFGANARIIVRFNKHRMGLNEVGI